MNRILRFFAAGAAALCLAAVNGAAIAQPKDRGDKGGGKDRTEQQDKGKGGDKEKKAKKHKHENGKSLVGDKVKKNGKHEFHKHGKHTAFVDVQNGKIRGVSVKHAEKGDVPVKKYKTNKKMAEAPASGVVPVNLILAQTQYLGQTWIGYSYIDEWGDEVIYWFPYDMIYDGDTGAVEYIPADY
jgi:hypothetical protein